MTTGGTTYARLINLLDKAGARYRIIDHPPEGTTAAASRLRGHPLAQAAKCIVTRVKKGKKSRHFVLAVVPGDALVDLDILKELYGGTYVSFATTETAERLAGSVCGTVVPFSFVDELELVVDPGLLVHPTVFFNAARLDRSIALDTGDCLTISRPRVEPIAKGASK